MKRLLIGTFAALALALGGAPLVAGTAMAQQLCISGSWATGNCELGAEDVVNTKHNFFLNRDTGYTQANTTEVCVFCHTPHGGRPSDPSTAVPLWNRAMPDTSQVYQMYNSPNFDGATSWINGKPQGVSLACLSCHDGTVGIDSLINAPGSGGFIAANKATPSGPDTSMAFHNGVATLGVDADGSMSETTRADCTPGAAGNCFQFPMGPQTNSQFFAGFPTNFVGTFGMSPFPNLTPDLRDDHPISMQIPAPAVDPQFTQINTNFVNSKPADGSGVTWLSRTGTVNDDVRDRLRAYPTGGNNTQYVECASCHNPHTPRPLFLRLPNVAVALPTGGGTTQWAAHTGNVGDTTLVSNNPNFQSAICLSCHQK